MEGERLLQCIKNGTDGGSLLRDLEVYLAPLLRSKTSPSQQLATKYGLYSMKMLRACVQQLTALKKGHSDVPSIIVVANRSYECVCRAMKHTKTVPLSLEKLLFHMVVQIMGKGLVADAMVFARNLREQLNLCRPDFITSDGVDNEYDTVCKQAFNQLWKACVDLEHSSKQGGSKHMVVLDVRLQALSFLMLSTYEVSWVFERAVRAVAEFDLASGNSVEEHHQVFNFLRSVLDALLSDVGSAKHQEDLQAADISEHFSPLFELNLHFAKRCKHIQKPADAIGHCEKLQKLISTKCSRQCGKLYNAAVSITAATLHMSKASPPSGVSKNLKKSKANTDGDSLETIIKRIQETVSSTSKAVEKGDPDFSAIHCLVEALEFFKKKFECAANQQDRSQSPSLTSSIPDQLVPSVDVALNLLLDLLQLQREHLQNADAEKSAGRAKQQRLSLQKVINRQLAVLHLMSAILLHRMNNPREEAGCEDTRNLSEDALYVCRQTLALIEEVSGGAGGSVSTNEHRWLGTNAYNLGLVCYRRKWYPQAAPLLVLACRQLETWCVTKELRDEEKITKVQLLSKYELLVDCQRKAGQHRDAMGTVVTYLWAHARHLTGQLTTPVELWVKAKREAVKSSQDERLRTRTLFDAIQEIEGALPDESASLVSRLLEQELGIYKTQRHDTTVEQYAVVCDLLSLYSDDRMRLHRAHAHIEQAQLLREGTLETDCSPVDCCREAIHLLEDLAQDFMLQQQQQQQDKAGSSRDYLVVFDLLATAHFWLYICDSEANQATYITSQFVTTKDDSVPPAPQDVATGKKDKPSGDQTSPSYTLAAEYSAVQPLDKALDIWADLMAEGCNQSMFNDPASTCYCLKVAASLCELADRPIRQLQALNLLVLLSAATSSSEDAVLACCQILLALCRLGAASEAEGLLVQARALLAQAGGEGGDGTGVEAALTMTECYVLLAAHKIEEFETLLGRLLQSHGHKRRSRQTYLRNATLKHLQSLYLLLPPTERSRDASGHPDLIPRDPSALELRAEAMRLQMGVGRLVFGDEVFGNDHSLQADGFKLVTAGSDSGWNDIEFNQWTVMASVLQSLLDVGCLYMEQGCVREAKSYLKEGLLLAEKFMLPRRCAAFLLQLSNLHTQCGQEEDCQASLSKVQQTLHLPQKASRKAQDKEKARGKESARGSSTPEEDEDDEDDFIRTKRMSVSTESFSRTRNSSNSASSPSLRPQTVKLPSYHSHPSDCFCVSCTDVSLHVLELGLFLRRAQRLELQGEPSEALVNLRAGLNLGDWSTERMPSLLCKNCSLLKNATAVVEINKKGKRSQKADAVSSRLSQCRTHLDSLIAIHVCIARLNLLNGSLSDAGVSVKSGLALAVHGSIHKSWLQFYDVLASLELKVRGEETTVRDLISSTWNVQSSGQHHQPLQAPDKDLVAQFDQLDLGKPSRKSQTHFQNSLFSERMQRPEVSRKLSEKVSELGIFCDISDNEDSDCTQSDPLRSAKCIKSSQTTVAETPQNVTSNSRKGNMVFSVRKKKPSKVVLQDEVTPVIRTISTSAFDFDEPSPVKTKKAGRGKSSKTGRRNAKIVDLDSDVDQVFVEEAKGSRSSARSKKLTTAKKLARLNVDSENVQNPLENTEQETRSSRKSKQAAEANKDSVDKPRRGRKAQAAEPELPGPKTTSVRPKRGRKPNMENLRSEVMTQVSDAGLVDLLSTSLELESPVRVHPSPPRSPDLGLNHEFEETSMRVSPIYVSCDADSNRPLLILEDLDEIEIPRAGRDSDSDESKSSLTVLRKTARKPAASRRKTAKKLPVEEAEVMRGTKSSSVNVQTKTKTLQPTAAILDGVPESGSLMTGTDVDSVIATLERIASELGHRAPTVLYRSVCQLLAMCYGDRDPEKTAYYLSEATAVTLRHQKLASLTKKIKKVKKDIDTDSVQNVPDNPTTSTQAAVSETEGTNHSSNLQHLTEERTLFSFRNNSPGEECLDVVQQTLNVLPEGWTVCLLSVVPSGPSLTGGLSDGDSLLMCRLSRGCRPVIINHNMHAAGLASSPSSLLGEFDNILSESKLSVQETDKRAWWTCRQQLDQRMQALTEGMEETFLGPWKGMVRGARSDVEERKSLALAAKKLQALLETTCKKQVDSQLCQCIVESAPQLSKVQLNSALTSLTGLPSGSEQHGSLASSVRQLAKDWAPATCREPVILILDKQIQQLPWENTGILRDSPVCRMPSMYFILSHLKARTVASPSSTPLTHGLDPSDAYFILNPSNDLANTQKTFQRWFERENGWQGVVARPPTKEEYKSALVDHQLFVFCGHGNGREFLTGDDIQRLTCRATSLLIGCSSGRLHVTGAQEASGMVLNYLVAECPCLVANLWDVTDRDIDRFLEQLLRSWLGRDANGGGSLLDSMAGARQACKLQYLIGCSPVVYGLPVHLGVKAGGV